MRRTILALLVLIHSAAPVMAARVRLRGIAASDRGPTVLFVVLLAVSTTTGAGQGRFICRPGSALCLFPRGRLGVQFFDDGSFSGRVLSPRGSCAVDGDLAGSGV